VTSVAQSYCNFIKRREYFLCAKTNNHFISPSHKIPKCTDSRVHALDFAYGNSQSKGKCYNTFRQRLTVCFPVVFFRHLTGETHLWVSQFYYAAGGSITPVSMLIISFFNPHRIFIPLH